MNAEQKAKAIACIKAAPKIGALQAFYENGNPRCSIGHLLACAGVRGKDARAKERNGDGDYLDRFPELVSIYGLTSVEQRAIIYDNDNVVGTEARRRAVLSYLESVETS